MIKKNNDDLFIEFKKEFYYTGATGYFSKKVADLTVDKYLNLLGSKKPKTAGLFSGLVIITSLVEMFVKVCLYISLFFIGANFGISWVVTLLGLIIFTMAKYLYKIWNEEWN